MMGITFLVIIALSVCGLQITGADSSDCGPQYKNWLLFNDHCYLLEGRIGSAFTWYEADKYCRDRGSLLASIHSAEENEFIAKQTTWTRLHPVLWLGLNTLEDNTKISWLDKSPIDFANVNITFVDNTRRCAALDSPDPNRRWLFMHCDTEAAFVCKRKKDDKPVTISPPVTPSDPGNCPAEWTRIGNKCFRIFSSKDGHSVNHSTARSQCVSMGIGHDLASLHNPEENLALTTLTANEETNLWIGLSRVDFNTLGWTDNTQFTFNNWAPGEPSSVAEGCTEFLTTKFRSGMWNDISCRSMMGYICQRSPALGVTTSRPPPSDCADEGFLRFGESCFGAFQGADQVTWLEAENVCNAHNGHLASVHTGQELAFIKKYILPEAHGPVWIGLSTTEQKVYQWSDGWPVTYLDFQKGFIPGADQCGLINSNGTWNVGDCNARRGFLCRVTEEDLPDYPVLDSRPCPTYISPLVDIGLKNCYAIRSATSWALANLQCMRNDTALMSVHHIHELELLAPHLINFPKGFWVGQIRKYHGGFEWVDGTKSDLKFWGINEPSNNPKDNCVTVSPISLKASAKDCSESFAYVCMVSKG